MDQIANYNDDSDDELSVATPIQMFMGTLQSTQQKTEVAMQVINKHMTVSQCAKFYSIGTSTVKRWVQSVRSGFGRPTILDKESVLSIAEKLESGDLPDSDDIRSEIRLEHKKTTKRRRPVVDYNNIKKVSRRSVLRYEVKFKQLTTVPEIVSQEVGAIFST